MASLTTMQRCTMSVSARRGLPSAPRSVRSMRVTASAHDAKPRHEVVLNSSILPLVPIAAAGPLRAALEPAANYFASLNLPEWLVHWGHPGNMAVVLLAMGGYGSYLGWQIRLSDDPDTIEKAKDAHPKLATGMAVFFALGAIGGLLSLTMQGKDIMSSPHFLTGVAGLGALAFQAMMPLFFQDDPNARGIHAYLGTGIMALFLVHLALGLQLGFSI